jgi:hypothetical protein
MMNLLMFLLTLLFLARPGIAEGASAGQSAEGPRTPSARPVSIVATLDDTGKYVSAALVITNRSEHAVEVAPEHMTLVLLDSKPPKRLEYVPFKVVVGDIERGVRQSRYDASLAAANANRTESSTTNTSGNVRVSGDGGAANGTYNENKTSTRQVPDDRAREQIWENQRRAEERGYRSEQSVSSGALRPRVLQPAQSTSGVVYFKRPRSCGSRNGCHLKLTVALEESISEFSTLLRME